MNTTVKEIVEEFEKRAYGDFDNYTVAEFLRYNLHTLLAYIRSLEGEVEYWQETCAKQGDQISNLIAQVFILKDSLDTKERIIEDLKSKFKID